VNAKVIVCAFAGHRWHEAKDVYEPFPVLRCARCGRNQELTAESSRPEGWFERSGRAARAGTFMDGRIQRRP
jgi:hypothetical protein